MPVFYSSPALHDARQPAPFIRSSRRHPFAEAAALLVVVVDCCNNYPGQTAHLQPAPHYERTESDRGVQGDVPDVSRSVLVSSSSPGQSASGRRLGGLFINQFMDTFYTLAPTAGASLRWTAWLTETRTRTEAEAMLYDNPRHRSSRSPRRRSPSRRPIRSPTPTPIRRLIPTRRPPARRHDHRSAGHDR